MSGVVQLKKSQTLSFDSAWQHDKIDRSRIGEFLTPIVASIRQPFVISLCSPYGTGKTFFIKNWQKDLNKKGFSTVYFNAWETDYAEDALIAFISSIRKQLETEEGKNSKAKKASELAKKGGAYLTRKIAPLVVKGLASKALGTQVVEDLIGLSDKTDDQISEFFGGIAEEALKRHDAVEKSIDGFKNYLSKFVKEFTKDKEETKRKLIIFVDELDRCRPTYAIEILECIKHLFNVEGIVFILAVDDQQLRNSISAVYGLRTDGEGYLRKFIDWQIQLPKPQTRDYANYLFDYFDLEGTGKFRPNGGVRDGKDGLLRAFTIFSEGFQLTLRQQAHCFTDINISIRLLEKNSSPLAQILATIATFREAFPNEIEDYCLGKKPIDDLLKRLDPLFSDKEDIFSNFYGHWQRFRAVIHVTFLDEASMKRIISKGQELSQSMHNQATPRQREMEKELEYIALLTEAANHYNIYSFSHSPAETVYMRLNKASFLSIKGLN
jgi:hypothetical protein